MAAKALHFSITGEFVTDLARTWFWEENKPFETCQELIGCCVQGPPEVVQEITIAILEGRKAFTGVNTFSYIDDGKQIRPLTDKITQLEQTLGIERIKADMQARFIRYVDPWATVKSCHPEVLAAGGNPTSYEECVEWFAMDGGTRFREPEMLLLSGTPILETPAMGGLWLIRRPDLAYMACRGNGNQVGTPEFWKAIYEAIKEDPAMKLRNDRYLFSLRPKTALFSPERAKAVPVRQDVPRYLTPEWFAYKYRETGSMEYVLQPDEGLGWESLVAPNGDWYTCPFGCHNAKAYYLILFHPEWIGKTAETLADTEGLDLSTGLDFLVKAGWCACRSVGGDHVKFPELPKQMTKAQALRILDTMAKEGVRLPQSQEQEIYDRA